MSRISLATDVRTRAGNPDKDARMKNAYIELRGERSAARKRPSAQGGVPVGLGTPQGGYGLVLFWGDIAYPITINTGTTWNGGTGYNIGDHVSVNFTDYWATASNTGSLPPSVNWSRSFVAPVVPSVIYHNGTQQNTSGGWGWSTLFNTFNTANTCTTLNLVPILLNTDPISPFWPMVEWYNTSGVFQSSIDVTFSDIVDGGTGMFFYQMIAAVSTNDAVIIASWGFCGGTLRLVKVTNSSVSVLADIAANATSCGATLGFRFRMNADNLGNCFILDSGRSMLPTTKKISSSGVVTDLGVVPLPS